MHKRNFYYDQNLMESDLDELQTLTEEAIGNLAGDYFSEGIFMKFNKPHQSDSPDMIVHVHGNCVYIKESVRNNHLVPVRWGETLSIDCSRDFLGNSVIPCPGNRRYISAFIRFKRNESNQKTDGHGNSIFYNQDEGYEIEIHAGEESRTPGKLPVPDYCALLFDVLIDENVTAIIEPADWSTPLNNQIDITRVKFNFSLIKSGNNDYIEIENIRSNDIKTNMIESDDIITKNTIQTKKIISKVAEIEAVHKRCQSVPLLAEMFGLEHESFNNSFLLKEDFMKIYHYNEGSFWGYSKNTKRFLKINKQNLSTELSIKIQTNGVMGKCINNKDYIIFNIINDANVESVIYLYDKKKNVLLNYDFGSKIYDITCLHNRLYISLDSLQIIIFNLDTLQIVEEVSFSSGYGSPVVFDGKNLWKPEIQSITSINPVTKSKRTYPLNCTPEILIFDGVHLWGYYNNQEEPVVCFNTKTSNQQNISIGANRQVNSMVFDGKHLWVSGSNKNNSNDCFLLKINVYNYEVTEFISDYTMKTIVLFDGTFLWYKEGFNPEVLKKVLV